MLTPALATVIIAYEAGELTGAEALDLFQSLLDSGVIYRLQGHYQRRATELVALGYCIPPGAPPNAARRTLEGN
jgi:hypothetical protein